MMRGLRPYVTLILLAGVLTVRCGGFPAGPGAGQTVTPPGDTAVGEADGASADGAVVVPTPNAEDLAQDLQGGDMAQRLAVASRLPDRGDVPLEARVGYLVEALDREIIEPTGGSAPANSYLPASSLLKLHLTRALTELGPDAIPELRKAAADASGELQSHLLIALAYLGDQQAVPQVRDLVTGASDPTVRMDAARALGQAGDADAIPQLETALQDDYVVTGTGDLGPYTLYPVREQAAGALRALGMTVERLADDTFGVRE